MRDANIYAMVDDLNGKVALLAGQIQFVELRLQSYEAVLKTLLKADDMKELIDAEHLKILQVTHAAQLEARRKAQEEARKPQLLRVN